MPYSELILGAMTVGVSTFIGIVSSWFAKRVHVLEDRIDTLEAEQQFQWGRERQLVDFIYKHDLTPPPAPERTAA